MLRTTGVVASSSWKRLAMSTRTNLRQLSTKDTRGAVPKNGGGAPTPNPTVVKPNLTPNKENGGGGGGLGKLFLFVATVGGGLGYLSYEKEMGNSMAEHIASQPYISDVVDYYVKMFHLTGILPANKEDAEKTSTAVAPYHHKTTAEIIQESHKSDPYGVPAIDEEHAQQHHHVDVSVAVDAFSTPEDEVTVSSTVGLTASDEENAVVQAFETAVDDAARAVTVAVSTEDNKNNNAVADNNDATASNTKTNSVDTQTPSTTTTTTTTPASLLPEVGAEITLKSTLTAASSRDVLQSAAKSSLALRQELETLMLKDVQAMDAPQLRLRVQQLATELFERLSWENMRLNHAIAQVEEELSDRYERLFAKQRQDLEFEIEKILFEKEKQLATVSVESQQALEEKYNVQLQQAIKAQAEGFQATLTQSLQEQHASLVDDFQSQANQHVALLRKQHNEAMLHTQGDIEALKAQVLACNTVLNQVGATVDATLQSHDISTAVLSLESMLSQPSAHLRRLHLMKDEMQNNNNSNNNKNNNKNNNSNNITLAGHWQRIRSLANHDTLVVSILDALPTRVIEQGAPTLSELQVRFAVMRDEARKAALAPEQAPKMIGQLIGTVLAKVSSTPSGYIAGPGVEEALARAHYFLERGKLKDAVAEVKQVEGYAQVIAHDWVVLAEDRLLVDQSIVALKADAIVRHRNFQN